MPYNKSDVSTRQQLVLCDACCEVNGDAIVLVAVVCAARDQVTHSIV